MTINICSWCNKFFKSKPENRCTCKGFFCSNECELEHSDGATIEELKELENCAD